MAPVSRFSTSLLFGSVSWFSVGHVGAAENPTGMLFPIDIGKVVCEKKAVSVAVNRDNLGTGVQAPVLLRTSGSAATVGMSIGVNQADVVKPASIEGDIMTVQSLVLQTLDGRRLVEQARTWVQSTFSRPPVWRLAGQPAEAATQAAGPAAAAVAMEQRPAEVKASGTDSGTAPFTVAGALPPPGSVQDEDVAAGSGRLCEEFFLLDGRSPVHLPDTWKEARQDSVFICEDFGYSLEVCGRTLDGIFEGYPDSGDNFDYQATLCERLSAWATTADDAGAFKPRRLKSSGGGGGYVSSGGAASPGGFASKRMGGRTYGYSTSTLGSRFGPGYRMTAFGFAGLAAGGIGGYALYRGMNGYGGSRFRDDDGGVKLDPDEKLYREDFVNFAFEPEKERYPLYVNIYSVDGGVFAKTDFCSGYGNSLYEIPSGGGLFVSFSPVEEMQWEEDNGAAIAIAVIVFVLISCCCFSCCAWRLYKRSQAQKAAQEEVVQQNNGTVVFGVPVGGIRT